ncbi:DUF2079 domain-containing protein [Streptomyces avicenniae]|uniref:DUF2079 domain-containing protein n=1 Tax=Streptomyces avicenniae TaxID=500153 RepID=UPI00069A92FE|nr:DUF2079 domain-containing protein [Streptomyces avicenniae]
MTTLTAAGGREADADAGPIAGRRAPSWRRPRADPYWLAGAFFVLYTAVSVTRHLRWESRSWDLGIFEQAVRSYAGLQLPVSDLKGRDFALLGDHFSPVTALIAPFYRMFPTPVTLLVAQAALFALAVVPVTRAAAHLLGRSAGAAIGAAYGLSWGVQEAVDFDFHEIAFAVPLIAFSLEALLKGRHRAALWWALPLLLVKEDLGLTAAAIAAVVALRARGGPDPRMVRRAVGFAVVAALACLVTIAVLIPAFNSGGGYDYWTKVGEGDGPLRTAFTDADQKLRTLLWVLVPTTGLLALRSPLLLVLLPTLGWRFVSHDPHYWGTDWHYSAVLMPVTALALADAVARTRADGPRPWLRAYAERLPLGVLAAALALSTTLPVAGLTHAATYRQGEAAEAGERVLSVIPDGAEVAANVRPIAHLTARCRVFWIGNTDGPAPEYIAYWDPARTAEELTQYAHRIHPDGVYDVVAQEAGFWVLRMR